jgi:2-polyprenyl-6-methoxyphenol hydroxylase-like FAD-dependent oxidoreductase
MRFAIAGGGFAGLAAALAVARAGHEAVVVERDLVEPTDDPRTAFDAARKGIPHFLQPHAFLPRGRKALEELAPDVLDALIEAGADPQDLAAKLHGPREPADDDLVYLWVRRPVIEWALRKAVAAEQTVELIPGAHVEGLLSEQGRATGIATTRGPFHADVVVDALGRYRPPQSWPRTNATPEDSGAVYFCRYFELASGAEHLDWPLLNPRGDLGYMGFNTFRGDNRTFAIILLTPAADRELRVLKDEHAWMAACAMTKPLDVMTSPEHARPLTRVMPMGGLMNVDRTGETGTRNLVAVGDALCHTDPAFAYGLSFALVHAHALGRAAANHPDDVAAAYRAAVTPETRERYRLACETDDARGRRWEGERLDIRSAAGCYPLFAFAAAIAAAPHDDHVLRRTIGRIGLLDRTATFDDDTELHCRIERIVTASPPPPPGPPRDELLRVASSAPAPR